MQTRVWARGITTSYGYNNAGDFSRGSYSDSTPAVTNTFDRLGRKGTIVCNGMTNTLAYNTANELLSETFSGGTLNGLAVTNAYDAYLRRTAVALSNQPSTLVQFGYDNASRLQGVTNGSYNAAYAYLANSRLVSTLIFRTNTTTRMTTTKTYDYLNRLTQISNAPSASSVVSFTYAYNDANQRTRSTLADGSYWLYDYDSLGQIKSGRKYWSDGTPVAGQQFEYAFDDIGNRTQTKAGGDENGWNLRAANYGANSLNQYTNRDVPGYVDIMGLSFATNSVTVNSQIAYRKGEYFRKELSVDNASASLWTNIIVASTGQTSVTGNGFVARTPEAFTYDADGNLTSDGRWTNRWDGENRLIGIETLSSVPTGGKKALGVSYDARSRRQSLVVSNWSGSAWTNVTSQTRRFVYDGWNLLASLDGNNTLVQSFAWGLDLSGSAQGAGGVGGLLALNDATNGTHFCAYDGNGNVSALVKGTDGTISANYEYGTFGEALRSTGPMAKTNPVRFSTKYQDDESDLVYYGYRFYNPNPGRWLNRDPIEEHGGNNLYGYAFNDPVQRTDPDGRAIFSTHCCCNNKSISNKSVDSGVVQYTWRESDRGGGKIHVWLEWDGGSGDSNSKDVLRPPGDGIVMSPAGYTDPKAERKPLKMNPCKIDFAKLNACLTRVAKEWNDIQKNIGDCRRFPPAILDACLKESKGCTVPPGTWPSCR